METDTTTHFCLIIVDLCFSSLANSISFCLSFISLFSFETAGTVTAVVFEAAAATVALAAATVAAVMVLATSVVLSASVLAIVEDTVVTGVEVVLGVPDRVTVGGGTGYVRGATMCTGG